MAPSRKRAPADQVSKRPANKKSKTAASQDNPTKLSITKELTKHGFSKSKKPKYSVGIKLLLNDSIYESRVPDEVKGHHFLYEISEVHENGKTVTLRYLDQVIAADGNKFRVYKDSEETQVRYERLGI